MFSGSIVALVTPFSKGQIDEEAFRGLVDWHIEAGTHGLVPCGTTGEAPTLSMQEHKNVIDLCIDQAKGRIPIMAGTGLNDTAKAIELTQHARDAGADAALIVTPYYNKPTQEGLYQHYKAIHDAVDIPIYIYDIPGRSIVEMSVETMARLARLERIVGVKDASNDLAKPLRIRTEIGPDFIILSGEDATATALLAQGGHGCISVTANIAPAECAQMHEAWQNGDLETMARLRDMLMPLHQAMFAETSPQPVKYALNRMGRCSDEVRLPLVPASDTARKAVDGALAQSGLLNKKAA